MNQNRTQADERLGTGEAGTGKRTRRLPAPSLAPLLGLIWLVIALYPVYYMFITTLRSRSEFLEASPWLPPLSPTLENYISVLTSGFGRYFINSVVVTLLTVSLIVFVSFLAAYVISRVRSRAVYLTFNLFLLGLAIPLQAAIVPIYILIIQMGLYDTLLALVFPQVAFGIPLTILILVNFIRDIPNELYDSMVIEGAGHFRLLRSLVLPLSRPALITVVIYNAIQVWNNFLFPLVLTQSSNIRVLPLALREFQGQFGINVPGLMAAVFLSALPIIFLYIVARRQLLGGLTAGFGK
jgi:raffinose/stachyose/melibiose transport system permease protein